MRVLSVGNSLITGHREHDGRNITVQPMCGILIGTIMLMSIGKLNAAPYSLPVQPNSRIPDEKSSFRTRLGPGGDSSELGDAIYYQPPPPPPLVPAIEDNKFRQAHRFQFRPNQAHALAPGSATTQPQLIRSTLTPPPPPPYPPALPQARSEPWRALPAPIRASGEPALANNNGSSIAQPANLVTEPRSQLSIWQQAQQLLHQPSRPQQVFGNKQVVQQPQQRVPGASPAKSFQTASNSQLPAAKTTPTKTTAATTTTTTTTTTATTLPVSMAPVSVDSEGPFSGALFACRGCDAPGWMPLFKSLMSLQNPKLLGGDILVPTGARRSPLVANGFWSGRASSPTTTATTTTTTTTTTKASRSALVDPVSLWPNGIIFYELDESLAHLANLIWRAMEQFHRNTCIRFVPRQNNEPDFVRLAAHRGCSSYIGRIGGEQTISLGDGCEYRGTIAHELLHAVGFYHHQNRSDRDEFLEIIWENVAKGKEDQFKKMSASENFLLDEFDYNSIMLYGPHTFGKTLDKITMKPKRAGVTLLELIEKRGLSALDINSVNKLYNCGSRFSYYELREPPASR